MTPLLLFLGTTSSFAAEGGKGSNVLEEIVVTARYREENLQQTPIAITAVTGEDLQVRSLTKIEEIGATIPNAFIRPGAAINATAPQIGLRGAIQADFIYAFEPAVAVYIDDVYFGTLTGSSFDLMDLERVEVLRGPQGTLFGKNSLGGAIRMVSKKPVGDNSGYVEATYGDYDRLDVKAAYDFALVPEKVFVRATGMSKHRDGYMDRLDFTCQMIANGTPQLAGINDGIGGAVQDGYLLPPNTPRSPVPAGVPRYVGVPVPVGSAADNAFAFPQLRPSARRNGCKLGTLGGQDVQAARLAVRYTPTDALEINVIGDWADEDSEPPATNLLTGTLLTSAIDSWYSNNVIFRRWGINYTDNRFVTGKRFATYATYADPLTGQSNGAVVSNTSWGISGTADYKISNDLNVKLITAYRTYSSIGSSDLDMTPIATSHNFNLQDHRQFSAELQVGGNIFANRVNWTVGGFYYNAHSSLGGEIALAPLNYFPFVNLPEFGQDDRFQTENKSAFIHVVTNILDNLALTTGIRYSDESKEYDFSHPPYLTIAQPALSSDTRFDWKVGLDYKITDEHLVYGLVSTGYRSSGFNPRPFTSAQLIAFPQEEMLNYEAGAKMQFFDNRLRVNTAVFYSEYDPRIIQQQARQCSAADVYSDPIFGIGGAQSPTPCPAGTPLAGQPGFSWVYYQASKGNVKGAELELESRPIEGLSVNGSVGFNTFRAENRDKDTLLQPEWNASLGVQYDVALGSAGTLTPRIDGFYNSHMTNNPITTLAPRDPDEIVPGYTVYNARLTYMTDDRGWTAALAVTNLFDKEYYYALGPATQTTQTPGGQVVVLPQGGRVAQPGMPRMWSVTLNRKF